MLKMICIKDIHRIEKEREKERTQHESIIDL